MKDHVVYLSRFLSWLREHELFLKKEKYELACAEFLGHLVSINRVRMDLKRAKVILIEQPLLPV